MKHPIADKSFFGKICGTSNKNESGRSLIEMLGTIAIITMITIGGITATQVGLDTYRTNVVQDEVEQIILGVQDLYSWQRGYSGLTMARICDNEVLDRACKGNVWTTSFGGSSKMSVEGEGDTFAVTVTDVPAFACRNLTNRTWAMVDPTQITIVGGSCPTGRKGTRTLKFYPKN